MLVFRRAFASRTTSIIGGIFAPARRMSVSATTASGRAPSAAFLDRLAALENLRPDTWYLIAVRKLPVLNRAATQSAPYTDRQRLRPPSDRLPPGYLKSTGMP